MLYNKYKCWLFIFTVMEGNDMEVKFYSCKACGNLLVPVIDPSIFPLCCGEIMDLLIPGSVDASSEKHVPVITRESDGSHIAIKVGSAAHPMTEEHLIQAIVLVKEDRFGVIKLSAGDAPEARCSFDDNTAPLKAYAYCNLHGIWEANI